ncbi:MAG TPA: helix-turn-helix domain-containing protein [Novosphingobium sp.]|jgi:excisionase family DNA binding protein|nr:helix-turn-helix domain-containing protein [Novosphingobium sp.]
MSDQVDAPAGGGEVDGPVLSEWLTQSELAAELRVSTDTLRRWQARRIGPPSIKLGMRVLYRRESVKEWLRSREKK